MRRKKGCSVRKTFAVIGGDLRQMFLARQLQALGHEVSTFAVPEADNAPTLRACVHAADVIVLPLPALSSADTVRATGGGIPLCDILDAATPGCTVCGGGLALAQTALARRAVRTFDYAQDETLLLENAELSAEGALALLMQWLHRPVMHSRVLLLGFGRIAGRLAQKLPALGAHICVAARNPRDRALARLLGCESAEPARALRDLAPFDAVINTVPAQLVTPAQLQSARPACLLLELASAPGGFCAEARARASYLAAPGLPGKYAPEEAAACICRALGRALQLGEFA